MATENILSYFEPNQFLLSSHVLDTSEFTFSYVSFDTNVPYNSGHLKQQIWILWTSLLIYLP